VFVAGREPAAARAGLEVDDLAALRFTDAVIDRTKGTVEVSWQGFAKRAAG